MPCACGSAENTDPAIRIELERMILTLGWDVPLELQTSCHKCLESMSNDLEQESSALNERRDLQGMFSILSSTGREFQDVAERFAKTCSQSIFRIEKIENKELLDVYTRAKSTAIGKEDWYFHGSNNDNYIKIVTNGFDMSKSKHGTLGRGVYFAENASYSHRMCF